MQAAFCVEKGKVVVKDTPIPVLTPGGVLVRVKSCGICGSDLHCYTGAVPPSPECMGHEISGTVAQAGDLVDDLAVGERVVVEPIIVCQKCRFCLSGRHQLCRQLRLLGATAPGGLAEFVAVPRYALHPIPRSLDLDLAALAEPMAVAVHAVRTAEVTLGQQALVLGAGSIGLLCLVAAKSAGARVAITARHAHQRRLAIALGAEEAFDSTDRAAIASYSERREVDLVLETVGGEADTLADALDFVRPGGQIITLGVFTKMLSLNPFQFMLKEIRLEASVFYSRAGHRADFSVALELLVREQPQLSGLVTHRVPLQGAAQGFAFAANKNSGAVKVLVEALEAN